MHRKLEHVRFVNKSMGGENLLTSCQPSIAKLLGYDSRLLSLYVEYIPGRDLGRCYHQSGPLYFICDLPYTGAVRVWQNMSSALAYLHEQGLIHNDVKPDNIM